MDYKDKNHPGHFVDRYNQIEDIIEEEKKPIQSEPSQVIDIGENYELVTGIDEDKAGGLDSRLMPNLHQRWIPSELSQGPYNDKLYKNSAEQEFYEGFIQPLFQIYKTGQFKKAMAAKERILTYNWEKKINIEVLGPEKALFQRADGMPKSLTIGEIEVTLILVTHFLDDLPKYKKSIIARRFGSSIAWVDSFRKKIQSVYGKLASISIEEHLEKQMMRCEAILDTYMEKAMSGNTQAAGVVRVFMDKEDQYIMPTMDQIPAKDTEEKRDAAIERLEKIFERRKIEDKNES